MPADGSDTITEEEAQRPGFLLSSQHLANPPREPATWSDKGGSGTIEYFPLGKSLVVKQTADVQEKIADLLCALGHSLREPLKPGADAGKS